MLKYKYFISISTLGSYYYPHFPDEEAGSAARLHRVVVRGVNSGVRWSWF